jgi:DNA repair protein RadC
MNIMFPCPRPPPPGYRLFRGTWNIFRLGTKSLLCAAEHKSEEHFVALHVNAKNEVTGYRLVSHGTVSSSLVHPRDVYKAALLDNAYAIIVAHNHPAGSKTPSQEDIDVTKTLIASGALLGVTLIDHLIISSRGGWSSLRETHSQLWD